MKFALGDLDDFKDRDVTKYGQDSYWQQRYEKDDSDFEWFVSLDETFQQYPMLQQLLQARAGQKGRVLELGCGTSGLSEKLWDLGFRDIVAIDNQAKAIEHCKARQDKEKTRQVVYQVADMTKLDFPDGSFDVIIEKGALDALVCRGSQQELSDVGAQLWRLLKPKETSVLISFSNTPLMEIPDAFKPWFERAQKWMVKNNNANAIMAKAYLFQRRKKKL